MPPPCPPPLGLVPKANLSCSALTSRGLSWAGSVCLCSQQPLIPTLPSPLLEATLQAIGSKLCVLGSTCLLDLSLQHHSLVPTLCQVLGTQKAHIPVPCSQSNGAERISMVQCDGAPGAVEAGMWLQQPGSQQAPQSVSFEG